jgi:Caspase domain.
MTRERLYIIIALVMLVIPLSAQRKRAFTVGISHYDTALTGYQWNNINGVEDVNLLSPILKKQGFYLTTLLDEQATYDNITRQLTTFVNKTKKGDIVYLHFSSHGQPVEDINGDEEDGWDEAIVPIDAYKIYKKGIYEGKKHLIDDQLNKYIKKLREKIGPSGFLYVIIDACHAGTSSRTNDDTVRGTKIGFTANNKVFKPSTSKKSHYKVEASTKLANVLFVEACRADQVNTEIKVGNKSYGPLSYNISQTLNQKPLSVNANEFLTNLKASIVNGGHWPNNQNMVTETSY